MGPPGSPREEERDGGARECLLEMRDVVARRAQQHRQAIEGRTARRLVLDGAGDLDALACLAGPGGEVYGAVGGRDARGCGWEQRTLEGAARCGPARAPPRARGRR